jgi:predicted TIM-barrel fold metal-dependent hydrolase
MTGPYRYPSPRQGWLDRHREEIIDPALPILDAHHHVWQQAGNPYGPAELMADLRTGHNIIGTVFVQAHYAYRPDGPEELRSVGETERANAHAEDAAAAGAPEQICRGIVAFADLRLGDRVEPVLEAHRAAAPSRLKGIRHLLSRDPNFPNGVAVRPAEAGLLGTPAFRAGLACTARHGLTFDAMLYHSQLGELTDMARALPQLPIVIDHFGCILGVGPYRGREDESFAAWKADLANLAACPNVSMKLGGLGMIVCGFDYHERTDPPGSAELQAAWQPFFDVCLDLFGPSRCMFESNFPVDKGMFSYPVLWNTFKRLASGASADEKALLFRDTAIRFYGL